MNPMPFAIQGTHTLDLFPGADVEWKLESDGVLLTHRPSGRAERIPTDHPRGPATRSSPGSPSIA